MKIKIYKITLLSLTAVFLISTYIMLTASSGGIIGMTKRTTTTGCSCHGASPTVAVSVILEGPSSIRATDTATYRLRIARGPLVRGGTNIAAERGNLILSPLETQLQRFNVGGGLFELTHTSPKQPVNDTVVFTFRYIAPNTPNTKDTLYANGNSVNFNGGSDGDQWNFAVNKILDITPLTSIGGTGSEATGYKLGQNYPNPFNPATKINYSIKNDGFVSLKVFDILGKEVAVLVNKFERAGNYEVNFDLGQYSLSSGLYFYELRSGDFKETKKMLISK